MIIAFPTNNQKTINEKVGFSKYILIIDTDKNKKILLENPIFERAKKIKARDCGENALETGKILPPILRQYNIEIFYALKLGEGLLDNLEIYGIKPIITDKKEIEGLLEIPCQFR